MITYKINTVPRYDYAETVVHVNENDAGGTLAFQVYEADELLDMGGTYGTVTITLNIYKADETVYSEVVGESGSTSGFDTDNMEDGYFEVTVAEQMTAAPGKCIAEFVFVDGRGTRKACANFIWDVERSPLDMDGVESASTISYIESAIEAAQEATTLANSVVAEVTELAERAESAAEAAVNAGVASFNQRYGVVVAANGDYSADMITYDTSSTVDAALASLESKTTSLVATTSATGASTNVAAESSENIAVTVSITGGCAYTALGVVGYTMGTQYVYPWKFTLGSTSVTDNGDDTYTSRVTVTVGVRNPSASYSYSAVPTVRVLWVKAD